MHVMRSCGWNPLKEINVLIFLTVSLLSIISCLFSVLLLILVYLVITILLSSLFYKTYAVGFKCEHCIIYKVFKSCGLSRDISYTNISRTY